MRPANSTIARAALRGLGGGAVLGGLGFAVVLGGLAALSRVSCPALHMALAGLALGGLLLGPLVGMPLAIGRAMPRGPGARWFEGVLLAVLLGVGVAVCGGWAVCAVVESIDPRESFDPMVLAARMLPFGALTSGVVCLLAWKAPPRVLATSVT